MVIRIKGDIPKQLNELYNDYSFKIRYKNELKKRILDFYDSLLKGSVSEILELSKEYCVIENNEIKVFNEKFVNKYREELFISFNPLWYSNKRIKIKKEIEVKDLEKEIAKSIMSFLIKEHTNHDELLRDCSIYKNILSRERKMDVYQIKEDIIERFYTTSSHFVFDMLFENSNLNIKDVFDIRKDLKKYLNNVSYDDINFILKEFKYTLEKLNNNFEDYYLEVNKTKTSLFGKMSFEYKGLTIYPKDWKEKRYGIFLNKELNPILLEKENERKFKIIDKKIEASIRLRNEIFFLRKKRSLIIFLIKSLEKIEYTKWTKENIMTILEKENLNNVMFKKEDIKGEEYVY